MVPEASEFLVLGVGSHWGSPHRAEHWQPSRASLLSLPLEAPRPAFSSQKGGIPSAFWPGILCRGNCGPLGYVLEKAMATHSSTLAWKTPRMDEPGRLPSVGLLRVGHDLSDFTFTFHFHALEKEMATHSSILAWIIPGTVEPGGLPFMGSHRVGHD